MMDMASPKSIGQAITDREGIERACIAAARDVVLLHRTHGLPIEIWRDNQVVEITPDEFETLLDIREHKLNSTLESP